MTRLLPKLIAHADWSKDARKRWIAIAHLRGSQYHVTSTRLAGSPETLIESLKNEASGLPVLVGFDFPIGLPKAYADRADFGDFRTALRSLGSGDWHQFFSVAVTATDISLHRPFYPYTPRGTCRANLTNALQLQFDALYRLCERRTSSLPYPLFWTLGAKQVGRAAISGWHEVLQPALHHSGGNIGLWPFDGSLEALLRSREVVVCETYPAEAYSRLALTSALGRRWSKRRSEDRVALGRSVLHWASVHRLLMEPDAERQLLEGFGPHPEGEDAFDALIGLLGMIDALTSGETEPPDGPVAIRSVEGWILGCATSRVEAL
jgi:predicted nuclease with RNAse H fold